MTRTWEDFMENSRKIHEELVRRAEQEGFDDVEEYCDYVLSTHEPQDDLIVF